MGAQRSARLAARAFTTEAIKIENPATYAEAMASPHAPYWAAAMSDEHEALHSNGTWVLTRAPAGALILPCRWLYRLKYNQDGTIERYKARLIVGGHRQRDGIDYSDTFAKCVNLVTLRFFLANVAFLDLELASLDISNAFLNAELRTDVYMRQPEGYDNGDPSLVCKLVKTLYGLKQAPKEWFDLLSKTLSKLGFTISTSDAALWMRERNGCTTFLLFWVHDLLIAAANPEDIKSAKRDILSSFKGRDLGEPKSYLNIGITRDRKARTLTIAQPSYEKGLLERFNMSDCLPKAAPISAGADYSTFKETDIPLSADKPYKEIVGALLYLACTTRPDFSTSVGILARSCAKPAERHWLLAKGVLRYLKGSIGRGITYGLSSTPLEAWTDADFAACKDTRRSRSGFLCNVYGGAASWRSKLQTVVATSSAESEYIAAYYAAREATWLKRLCFDLGIPCNGPVVIKADNTAAMAMADNSGDSNLTKHMGYHYVRDKVACGAIRLKQCATADNVADIFTKPLGEAKVKVFTAAMGMT
jgi:hypothetical protein